MNNFAVNQLLLWIPLLPLFGAAINGIFGKRLPRALVPIIACGTVFISAVMAALVTTVVVRDNTRVAYDLGTWILSGANELSISGRLAVDQLSTIMICVITGVGFLIICTRPSTWLTTLRCTAISRISTCSSSR